MNSDILLNFSERGLGNQLKNKLIQIVFALIVKIKNLTENSQNVIKQFWNCRGNFWNETLNKKSRPRNTLTRQQINPHQNNLNLTNRKMQIRIKRKDVKKRMPDDPVQETVQNLLQMSFMRIF